MGDRTKAFPICSPTTTHYGMDLRDYFACKALQALILRSTLSAALEVEFTCETAYRFADAMMEERG